MPPLPLLVRMILMLSIATLVLAGLHYYVYARLGRYLLLGPAELRLLKIAVVALFVMLWCAIPMSRLLRWHASNGLLWTAYIWLGSLVILWVVFCGSDLAHALMSQLVRLAPP